MTEERYIIEYLGGCKGDMLTALLNRENLSIDDLRKVDRKGISLKDINNPLDPVGIILSAAELDKKLRILTEKFTTSHNLYFLKRSHHDVLDRLNFRIIKITFEEKHYQTIRIENLIKNLKNRDKMLDQRFGFLDVDDHDFFYIDYFLKEENIHITDENRAEKLDLLLKNQKQHFVNERIFNSQKNNQNKILWSYQALYVDLTPGYDLFNNIDMDLYKETVDRSWLPDEIQIFGETWKPRDYGYRSF